MRENCGFRVWFISCLLSMDFSVDRYSRFPALVWSDNTGNPRSPAQNNVFPFWSSQSYHNYLSISQWSMFCFPMNFKSPEKAVVSHLLSSPMHYKRNLIRAVIYLSLLPVAHCVLRKSRGRFKTFFIWSILDIWLGMGWKLP